MFTKAKLVVFWSLASGALLSAAGLELPNLSVGSSLQTSATVKLSEPAPQGGLEITIATEDPSLVKFAKRPDAGGTGSIVISVQAGFIESPDFWIQGLAGSGEAVYTATAQSFGTARGTVTLTPSGIAMVGPFKAGVFKTTTGAPASRLVLYSVRLTPGGEYAEQQAVAGGLSIDIHINNSAPDAGTVTPEKVNIPGGAPNAISEFKPAKPGTATLTASTPPGFSAPPPKYPSVVATVALPGMAITDQTLIGQNLQLGGNVSLGEAPGPEGLKVTLTSDDPSQLLLARSATEVGAKSIVITIPPDKVNAQYYLQALGKSGTVTYTATAPGFASRAARIGLAPSGVVIAPKAYGPPDEAELFRKGAEGGRGFILHLSRKVKMPLNVWTAQLDPITLRSADITVQPLRAGMNLTVKVESSSPAVGTVVSPVVIKGGSETGTTEFTPLSEGTAIITAITPEGFTKSANSTSVEAIVKKQ